MKEYNWRGHTYRIAEEDLHCYPGAALIKKEPDNKTGNAPKNKAGKPATNKDKEK